MDKVVSGIVTALLTIIVIGFVALLGGTVIWLIWPVAIPAAFPGLVASGLIVGKLAWWEAVCLTWLFGILIKSSSGSSNK